MPRKKKPVAAKFEQAQRGDAVYTAKLGRGEVVTVQDGKVLVQHTRAAAWYTLEGEGVHGRLHWFGVGKTSS